MFDYLSLLQLFVGYPTRYAIPTYGDLLPLPKPDSGLNELVPVWDSSIQCLLDDQAAGGRYLADILGKLTGTKIDKVVAKVCVAGWEDDPCTGLLISLFRTKTHKGTLLYLMNEELALAIADWLRDATQARWVVAVQPFKNIRVRSNADKETDNAHA